MNKLELIGPFKNNGSAEFNVYLTLPTRPGTIRGTTITDIEMIATISYVPIENGARRVVQIRSGYEKYRSNIEKLIQEHVDIRDIIHYCSKWYGKKPRVRPDEIGIVDEPYLKTVQCNCMFTSTGIYISGRRTRGRQEMED